MSRIGCPVCSGELSIASPPTQDHEMICRCVRCQRLILIEDTVVLSGTEAPPPPLPQDRTIHTEPGPIRLNTRLPPVLSYAA